MSLTLDKALDVINCIVLERVSPEHFKILHQQQDWGHWVVPNINDQDLFVVSDHSPFLQDFIVDAEAFWQLAEQGQLTSGIWTESTTDGELRLEATAAYINGGGLLIIRNLQEEYSRQQKTLQSARELLISNDKIVAEQEYIRDRLEQTLSKAKGLEASQEPINQVIKSAEFGVIIADRYFQPIIQNPIVFEMLELNENACEQQPLSILLELINSQFPEFQRLISTHSHWQGEVFWHKPIHLNKWFQLGLHPVCDDHQNVSHWVLLVSDVTRINYLLQRNEKLSLHDSLTELPNRQFFWRSVEQAIESKQPFYVLYLDIKHFKRVNELHGHLAGDQVLQELSKRMLPLVGERNILARIGGNEFGILLHNMDSQQECREYGKRLIQIAEQAFYVNQQSKINIGLNIGVAQYPIDGIAAEELIRYADMAVYNAKKQGKSYIAFYSKALKEASLKRIALEESLRKAIDEEQFELFLQPIINIQSGKVVKAEALIRWHNAAGKFIAPDAFIPLAEDTGLIIPIGKWVISKAAEMLKILHKYDPDLTLSINLSPKQVSDRHLFNFIKGVIEHCGIDAQKLELELTEGVLIDNFTRVQQLLNDVRKLGMSISIDDFGTGYSSLKYLQKLPIDYLKIDRSFVKDLDTNDNDRALVLAVIAMAHSLKLEVIAEGVETLQQSQFLQDNHCRNAQGYLYSKPIPFDEFCTFLLTHKS